VKSTNLNEHLSYLLQVLFPDHHDDRVELLRNMLRDGHIEADVSCFWFGKPGSYTPAISSDIVDAFRRLPARIEKDFHLH
jgi:hypothetical protein